MKLYRLQSFGGADGLALTNAEVPTPGRGEALVRVRASAVNARDLMIAAGMFGPAVPVGTIPLSDGAGEVVALGDGVTRVTVGDRVCPTYNDDWISGERYDLGFGRGGDGDGVLAEYVVRSAESLVHVPAHLSDAEAATLPCAALTAWNALCVYGVLLPGQNVLVQGSGGVALFALQFAKLFGARVIATTSSDAKAERLRALGADAVINYNTHPDWDVQAQRLSDGGIDVVVETGGGGTMPKSILSLRRGGRISVVGLMTGAPDQGLGAAFFGRYVHFHHIHVGSRDSFEAMNRAITYHRLQPVIGQRFDFDQAPVAYESLKSAGHFGKVVIGHD